MSCINFFTPIIYSSGYQKKASETLLETVDSYFYLGGKKAQVISTLSNNARSVVLVDSKASYITSALKVASYCLIFPPIIMLTAKLILRNMYTFQVSNPTTHSKSSIQQKPLPIPQASSYICPRLSRHFDAPLPLMNDKDQLLGIYGNILYPQDKEMELQKELYSWMKECHNTQTPSPCPINAKEMTQISVYMLERFPKKAARVYFAEHLKTSLANEAPFSEALLQATNATESFIKMFSTTASQFPQDVYQHRVLAKAFQTCVNGLNDQISRYGHYLGKLPNEDRNEHLLKEQFELINPSFSWDLRLKVFRQAVEKMQESSPSSPYFLALQEVTPEALSGLKKTLADKNLQWISFNNLSNQPTLNQAEEKVAGEATNFTSTIALSQDLEILKTDLGDLPSESGSLRRILGVRVRNKHSNQTYNLFTTHTDHVTNNNLYKRTAKKIHEFASQFLQGQSDRGKIVLGGDLNAFEDKGGEDYLKELKALFKSSKDFRETAYYAPPQTAWSTYIGRPGAPNIPKITRDGSLEKNALDHILVGPDIKLESAAKEALVYDDSGNLLDYHQHRAVYIANLLKRQTFSDHLFNIVRFS